MKVYELKVGDKVELRDDLEDGNWYGVDIYVKAIPITSHIEGLRDDERKMDIKESGYVVTPEMISKVNDRKVKFTGEGFEYIIEEEDVMIDPKSLVQSGDFVVCDCQGKERVYLAVQRGSKIALVQYPVGWD